MVVGGNDKWKTMPGENGSKIREVKYLKISVTNKPRVSPMATPIIPKIRLSEKKIQKTCRVEAPWERSTPISLVLSPMFIYIVFRTMTTATINAITDMICKPLFSPTVA